MKEFFLGFFWALTYILIVIAGFKYRKEKRLFMPLISGCLNLAWEILALWTSGGYWAHIVWLLLDIIIFSQNLSFIKKVKHRIIYGICAIAALIGLFFVFKTDAFDGMLVSSFAIDIIMACEYVILIKSISPRLIIAIGISRLLGDLFAWISNMHFSRFVMISGIIVLIVNVFYISYCLELISKKKQKK